MNDVVFLWAGARGDLDEGEAARWRDVVSEDADAAAFVSLMEAARTHEGLFDPVGPCGDCPDAGELAAFAEGGLDAPDAARVLTHLGQCAACVEDVDGALEAMAVTRGAAPFQETERAAVDALRTEAAGLVSGAGTTVPGTTASDSAAAPEPPPEVTGGGEVVRGPWRSAGWLAAAAALLLVAKIGFDTSGAASVVDLARLDPLPVRAPRGAGDIATPEGLILAGLAAYDRDDWSAAATSLEQAALLAPDREDVAVFLASCRLLEGSPAVAVGLLEPVVAAGGGPVEREALWVLAQAQLAQDDRDGAEATLTRLSSAGGSWAEQAEAQLAELAAR